MLEPLTNNNLWDYIFEEDNYVVGGNMTEKGAATIARQILKPLAQTGGFEGSAHIFHRDIKAECIHMIDENINKP